MAMRHKLIAAVAAATLCGMTAAHAIDGGATNDCAAAASRTAQIELHTSNYTARPLRMCERDAANLCRSAAPLPIAAMSQMDAPSSSRLALNVCYRASE
jgi:hypothetical protein